MLDSFVNLLDIADNLEEDGYYSLSDEIRATVGILRNNISPIDGIIKFQKDRLLDKQPFNFETEVLHILEELVEMLGYESLYARDKAKKIFDEHFTNKEPADKEKLVDAFADIIVFAVGSIMKLGYEPKCVLNEVSKEINSRVGSIIDGKFVKDKSPEARAKWHRTDFNQCLKG